MSHCNSLQLIIYNSNVTYDLEGRSHKLWKLVKIYVTNMKVEIYSTGTLFFLLLTMLCFKHISNLYIYFLTWKIQLKTKQRLKHTNTYSHKQLRFAITSYVERNRYVSCSYKNIFADLHIKEWKTERITAESFTRGL